ncbi:DUF3793 family protein [Heliobacterium undosum]|uniref:DUF3793 family protein n=1 Tax=Heliomicrobium undosum TaxID=121734 RepID=A0A845KYI4_9FIRM|nr:DUF3793 family protein [Heliomicrobium undosum]MZP28583.1 DUF3793 family protein [Heliomicrobium undosum]
MMEKAEPRFDDWKKSLDNKTAAQARFERWLFLYLSKVLFSGKPGELLRFSAPFFGRTVMDTLNESKAMASLWGLSTYHLRWSAQSAHVFFYDRQKLEGVLRGVAQNRLFHFLGYGPSVTAMSFLDGLAERWRQTGQIPHEIGIAVGYPLKDVLGYMGLVDLPKRMVREWCIYGREGASLQRKEQYDLGLQRGLEYLRTDQSAMIRDELCGHRSYTTYVCPEGDVAVQEDQ